MSKHKSENMTGRVSVRNIGGIDETEVSFSDGVTVLAGRNATNRTSLLQAIMGAMGSDELSLKGDATEGYAELTLEGNTYTRELERQNGHIVTSGDPMFDDSEMADLFAFLLESNEARQAVERRDDLREIIMRPVDTDSLEAEINRTEQQRQQIDSEIEELDTLSQRLPNLEEKRQRITAQIEKKETELEAKEKEVKEADSDVSSTREEKEKLESKLETLGDLRGQYEEKRENIETQQESIRALENELEELEEELETLPETPMSEVDELETRIEQLRDRKRSLDSTISDLRTIIQFNEDVLEDGVSNALEAFQEDDDNSGSVTDQLLEDQESLVCWTCGTEVEQNQIESAVDRLRTLHEENLSERNDIEAEIDALKNEQITREEKQRQRAQLEDRITQTESELDRRRNRVEELESALEELESEIEDLEAEVETLQNDTQQELLDSHKEVNQLEFELGRLESDLRDIESEIDEIEDKLDQREELRADREELNEKLTDLRTRIDRIESKAVEEFNGHMETVLSILEYENLKRIWIEPKQTQTRQGRRKVEKSTFDLHVVRSTETGTTYEDTVDHLSESEREITGLVFALAGYFTHNLHEEVPFLLLDSLEAIDSERIAAFIEYVDDYADYTIVALLPEDEQSVSKEYQRITEI